MELGICAVCVISGTQCCGFYNLLMTSNVRKMSFSRGKLFRDKILMYFVDVFAKGKQIILPLAVLY